MTDMTSDLSIVAASRRAGPTLLAGFALSLFDSAFLLFSVQPLVSRLVLPRLGGSPAVWNTCVCFFQAALLLGYGYAHLASTWLQPRAQVLLHMAVLASALVLMPLSLGVAAPPADTSPIGWLFALLTLTVGLPFVAIAATAPLMQTWFAGTTHPHARDPYFLYAASNAGSLVALLSYPVLVETTLGLSEQLQLWSAGLVIAAAAVLACGLAALLHSAAPVTMPIIRMRATPVAVSERLRWVVLAFVPVHGTRTGEKFEPLSYFRRNSPFGRAFVVIAKRPLPTATIDVIGLGTGALGCYARPGEAWTFYEIDPMVERFARDNRWFNFMSGCGNHPNVVLGDARVNLTVNPTVRYDVLILDAFSSDSVPMHLITREALALYFARLKPGGMLLFNITNRYLDLPAVVVRIAAEAGMPLRHLRVPAGDDILRQPRVEGLVMVAQGGNLDAFAADGWDEVTPGPMLWTDERSDIFGVIRWR